MNNYKLKDKVTCGRGYNHGEVFSVVGIREHELELEGDWSGGTHNVCQKDWVRISDCKLVEPRNVIGTKTGEGVIIRSNDGKYFGHGKLDYFSREWVDNPTDAIIWNEKLTTPTDVSYSDDFGLKDADLVKIKIITIIEEIN
jgi:hypothetical protein